jgi:hypothetical protein
MVADAAETGIVIRTLLAGSRKSARQTAPVTKQSGRTRKAALIEAWRRARTETVRASKSPKAPFPTDAADWR